MPPGSQRKNGTKLSNSSCRSPPWQIAIIPPSQYRDRLQCGIHDSKLVPQATLDAVIRVALSSHTSNSCRIHDILAISKDKKQLLVVELIKGRASDAVVGQTLRYMSFVQEMLAEKGQTVRGIIIALEDDQRIRRALAMVANVQFYRYQINFKLVRA